MITKKIIFCANLFFFSFFLRRHILGVPDPVEDCKAVNISTDSLSVRCQHGDDGGLPQVFSLEVVSTKTHRLVRNLTSTSSQWTIGNLVPGVTYLLTTYAHNRKGRSKKIILRVSTVLPPQKHNVITAGKTIYNDISCFYTASQNVS